MDDPGHILDKMVLLSFLFSKNDLGHPYRGYRCDIFVGNRQSMPIKSYLVHHKEGKKKVLLEQLNKLSGCEAIPSQNKDVIVLITDTHSKETEKKLEKELEALADIDHLALVSGFATELNQPQV